MGSLRILAEGESVQARAQKRGKLFEKLMAEVLNYYGYTIEDIPSRNYAGMEIDIVGNHKLNNVPIYAECKCYAIRVDTPKFQQFFAKFITRLQKNKQSHGYFIALPGINKSAKGFYEEYIENNYLITILEEKDVLEVILSTSNLEKLIFTSNPFLSKIGKMGDWIILYTEKGIYWLQYIIPLGEGIANSIILFDEEGNTLTKGKTYDFLKKLLPELNDFEFVSFADKPTQRLSQDLEEIDEIVEVKGSSKPLEYQFPASPSHFVGRSEVLNKIDIFLEDLIQKRTSSRSILIRAYSGWGKSSLVLAGMDRLKKKGHFAIAIDSRSASSSKFVLKAIYYIMKSFGDFNGLLSNDFSSKPVTGFEGAVKSLIEMGNQLESQNKILFIFFDQFENIFFLLDVIKRIRNLFLMIQDAQTNIVLGFCWKTDLVGYMSEFPYQIRDTILNPSFHINLNRFTIEEIDALLSKLKKEIGANLRKDLKFFLSSFSQGYPWLLKKLCAHVKSQIDNGIHQIDLASSLLNIEELFQEDLKGLTPQEEDALRTIAKVVPISVRDLGDDFTPGVIQSLVHRRLIVRIGTKYDIYWDIFRDFLNTDQIPVKDNYLLRLKVGSVWKAMRLLIETNRKISLSEFQERGGWKKGSVFNLVREMRVLGLIKVDSGNIGVSLEFPNKNTFEDLSKNPDLFESVLRRHLNDWLKRNRMAWILLETLESEGFLSIEETSNLLEESFPYISAHKKTWTSYAQTFASWLDVADLVTYDSNEMKIHSYTPGSQIRESRPIRKRMRKQTLPSIQYSPIEQMIIKLFESLERRELQINLREYSTNPAKVLPMLECLGFITRGPGNTITPTQKLYIFAKNPDKRAQIFAESASQMDSFAKFLEILEENKDKDLNRESLTVKLQKKLNVKWKRSTADYYIRIMMNWARYMNLNYTILGDRRRRKERIIGKKLDTYISKDK